MTGLSIYLKDTASGSFRSLQVGGSVPGTATTGTGWTVGTNGTGMQSYMASNVERASTTFVLNQDPPDSGPDSTLGDGFRTENVLNGRFVAGTWTIPIPVIAVTAGGAMDGRAKLRLWRSPNTDGSAATEVTAGAQAGSQVTNLTTAEQISTASISLGEFGLVDEYLFLSVDWRIIGAGGGATDDCLIRVGTSGTITTPDFTTATTTEYQVVLAGQGLIVAKGDYVRQMAQQFAAQLSTTATTGVRLGELTKVVPSWSGGSGFPNYDSDNPTRYASGYGVDVTTTKDKAQVGPGLTASLSSSRDAQRVFGTYNSQLYVGASTGQVARQTATDTWTDPVGTITSNRAVTGIQTSDYTTNNVTTRLWISNGVNAQLASYDGTTFTNNNADANVGTNALTYISCLGNWPNHDATTNLVIGGKRTSDGLAVIGMAFSGATPWASASTWVNGTTALRASTNGCSDITAMLLGSDDRFYWACGHPTSIIGQVFIDPKDTVAADEVPFSTLSAATNAGNLTDDYVTAFAELNNVIYAISYAGRLYKIDSDKLVLLASNINPSGGQLYGLAVWNGALWISGRSSTSLLVRRFGAPDPTNPSADDATWVWSEPIYGGAIDASATAARQLATFGGYLYAATEASGASKIYRMDDAVYSTSAVTLQAGEITFDSAVIVTRIKQEHTALVSGDSIQLKYARNGQSTFASLGTNSTVGSTSTSYAAAASGAVSRLSAQDVITSGSSSTTPQLGQLTIVVRPVGDVTREWTITFHAWVNSAWAQARKDNSAEPRTGQAIIDSMWTIFEEGVTQRYRDLDNAVWTVTVEDHSDSPEEELPHASGLRWTGTMKLREV